MQNFHIHYAEFTDLLIVEWCDPKTGGCKNSLRIYNSDARSVLVVAGGCEDIQ